MKAIDMTDFNPPKQSSQSWEGDYWTFDAVEERLIDAMLLWKRSPGGGKWPFAGDAPWHLMSRKTRTAEALTRGKLKPAEEAEVVARLLREEDDRETAQWQGRDRPRPLTRDEVDRRDEATEWLGFVPNADRKLVIMALTEKASGRKVSWMRLKPLLGVAFGADGLRKRYSRAISGIARALNARK